jgi:hypothetical protein
VIEEDEMHQGDDSAEDEDEDMITTPTADPMAILETEESEESEENEENEENNALASTSTAPKRRSSRGKSTWGKMMMKKKVVPWSLRSSKKKKLT